MRLRVQPELFLQSKISRHQFKEPLPIKVEEMIPVDIRDAVPGRVVGLSAGHETDPGDKVAAWPQDTLDGAQGHVRRNDVIQRGRGNDYVELRLIPRQKFRVALDELELALDLAGE